MTTKLKSNEPSGPVAEKWEKHKFDMKLVNPANKRKLNVIVWEWLSWCICICKFGELAITLIHLPIMNHHDVRTVLLHRVVLMLPKTIATMVIVFSVYFTTL